MTLFDYLNANPEVIGVIAWLIFIWILFRE